MGLVVGIDTGGTFTDLVVLDPDTGLIDSLKTSSMPSSPGQAIVNALDEGGVPAAEVGVVHPRDDRGDERADRADGVQGRVRDHEGVRGHALHPADQPQGAIRPALAQAGAARGEPPPVPRGRRAPERRGRDAAAGRRGRGARPVRDDPRGGRRGGGALRCSSPTSAPTTRRRSSGSSRRSCRGCRFRSRTRWRRSGASTSARRRRSPTPTCARCSAATSRASAPHCVTPA